MVCETVRFLESRTAPGATTRLCILVRAILAPLAATAISARRQASMLGQDPLAAGAPLVCLPGILATWRAVILWRFRLMLRYQLVRTITNQIGAPH